ncbi:MAG: DUF177 domain-containing protein [Paludibacteraceae bacterium]|nr:DUF177 domain-containing protein [Paludibacteraceae bacterium]
MSKFAAYNIDLKALGQGKHSYTYTLDDEYFGKIDSTEVQRGNVTAVVDVMASAAGYEVKFQVEGTAIIACDRCLDDMVQAIKADDKLRIRLGDELTDDGEVMVLPERDPVLNVAWFLYELIALAIPIKHVHAPGECNKTMAAKLRSHIAVSLNDEGDEEDEDSEYYEEED